MVPSESRSSSPELLNTPARCRNQKATITGDAQFAYFHQQKEGWGSCVCAQLQSSLVLLLLDDAIKDAPCFSHQISPSFELHQKGLLAALSLAGKQIVTVVRNFAKMLLFVWTFSGFYHQFIKLQKVLSILWCPPNCVKNWFY